MSFSIDIAKFAEKAKGNAALVVQKVIIDIGARLVEKSPVGDGNLWKHPPPKGYVGGRFRANWQYGNLRGVGIPMQSLPDIDPSGSVSNERIQSGVAQAEPFGVHYLINNLPYSQRLENGWSTQAPQGMVALTILEYKGIVNEAAAAVYHGRGSERIS